MSNQPNDPEQTVKDAQIARGAEPRVYFIEGVGTNLVKIGWAFNVSVRWTELATMSPVPLNLLAVMPGGREKEAEFHVLLAEHRHHGEWFCRCRAMNKIITKARASFGNPGELMKRGSVYYWVGFIDEQLGTRPMKPPPHDWTAIGQFRKCKACGEIRLVGGKARRRSCPGIIGRRHAIRRSTPPATPTPSESMQLAHD